MEEHNYLIFLMNNKLNVNYSMRDLKYEIKGRLKELGKGCGAKIEVPFDSEHPEKGGDIVECCETWKCVDCSGSENSPNPKVYDKDGVKRWEI